MHEHQTLRIERMPLCDASPCATLVLAQRELQLAPAPRDAEVIDDAQQALDLRFLFGPAQEIVARGAKAVRRREAAAAFRAHHSHDAVGALAAAVQLQRQVETPCTRLGEEARQPRACRRLLGQADRAGKAQPVVDVAVEASREGFGRRQSDQRDVRARPGVTQRAQHRHRAEQVAELQCAEHRDALRAFVNHRFDRQGCHPSQCSFQCSWSRNRSSRARIERRAGSSASAASTASRGSTPARHACVPLGHTLL